MISLGELINGTINFEQNDIKEEKSLHRTKGAPQRPKEEVNLLSVSKECIDMSRVAKTQLDPSDDLVEVRGGTTDLSVYCGDLSRGYLIWCHHTSQTWFAHDKHCLDANFIYREDLDILEIKNAEEAQEWFSTRGQEVNPGIISKKTCYILDNPMNETYEVYYDSNYPATKYGKAVPQGCNVHRYDNRFHRDMAIIELDEMYSNSSFKKAGEFIARKLRKNEAIIISDGAWMRENCSSAFVYLDNLSVVKMTEGFLPTEKDQAVLISEITGATNALLMCKARNKKHITYYYDNTSIINVFKNRKTEYIEEIRAYKELLKEMDEKGYTINFVELHPKTGENRDTENKALMFFHNLCDSECRAMSEMYSKDYQSFASNGSTDGKTYGNVKEEMAANKRKQANKKPKRY